MFGQQSNLSARAAANCSPHSRKLFGRSTGKSSTYLFSRVAKHGKRRAEEMREAANTVREAGIDPWMSAASAETQDWVAALSKRGVFRDLSAESGWRDYADKIIAVLENPGAIATKRSGRA